MFIGFSTMLDETLAPAGRPLGPNTPHTSGRISGIGPGSLELLRGLYPRDYHSVSSDIQCPLDQTGIELRNSNQSDGFTPDRRPDMFQDFLPIQMTKFGIYDEPIQTERHRHLGNTRRLQRNPQAVNGEISSKFLSQGLDRGG